MIIGVPILAMLVVMDALTDGVVLIGSGVKLGALSDAIKAAGVADAAVIAITTAVGGARVGTDVELATDVGGLGVIVAGRVAVRVAARVCVGCTSAMAAAVCVALAVLLLLFAAKSATTAPISNKTPTDMTPPKISGRLLRRKVVGVTLGVACAS